MGKTSLVTIIILMLLTGTAVGQQESCLDCHPDKKEGKIVHAAISMGCASCHSGTHAGEKPGPKLVSAVPDLCFSCHRWEVYGDRNAASATQQASRFNLPSDRGHAFHVGNRDVPCTACHAAHGSATLPALIVTGKNPGMIGYSQTSSGGTCTPTCHTPRSYTVNYAR